jgi:hypothetical protein
MLTAVDEVFRRSLTTLLTIYLVVGIGLMVALILIIRALVLTYLENRDTRLAACPKTERYAAEDKDIDALYTALFGAPALPVKNCSRRPEGAERFRPGHSHLVAQEPRRR